jgi:MFS family permease
MFLPLGISNGYVVVTLAYLLSHAGVSVAAIAGLAALSLFPQTWKFLLGPIIDTTLTNKLWFLLSAVATGLLMVATAIVPPVQKNLAAIEWLVVAFSVTTGLNAMAADSLMAHATTPDDKGRAGGWSQAGNLGGSGLGGGAGLWIAQHVSAAWVSGASLGLVCVFSAVAVLFLKEPPTEHRHERFVASLVNVGRDVWSICRARTGYLALFIMLLPIGVGAAQNLWAAVAGDWYAGPDTVALVNGTLGGVISMFGCLAGGYISDLIDRKGAYCLFGIVLAVCAAAMAVFPRTQAMFVVFTCLYAFILGLCYAAFGAVTLEAIGRGAAATKYNIIAGISNVPIAYQTLIAGWGQSRWGSGGMLWIEAACGAFAVGIYYLFAFATARIAGAPAAAQPAAS